MTDVILLTVSANGKDIYYDPVGSHAATHFADTPQLKALTQEILQTISLDKDWLLFDTDLLRVVGNTDLVENESGDTIIYAKRKNRDVYTSFNKSKTSQPCSIVTTGLEKQADGSYMLVSAWIGAASSPPFPGDERQTDQSIPYWTKHSLVWGTQEIQAGTEISDCPW